MMGIADLILVRITSTKKFHNVQYLHLIQPSEITFVFKFPLQAHIVAVTQSESVDKTRYA